MDLVLRQVLLRFQPSGGNGGQTALRQRTQVGLVRVPFKNVGVVQDSRNLLGPFEEGVALQRVVADRANDDHSGFVPVHVRVVPDFNLGVASAFRERVQQSFLTVVEVRHC